MIYHQIEFEHRTPPNLSALLGGEDSHQATDLSEDLDSLKATVQEEAWTKLKDAEFEEQAFRDFQEFSVDFMPYTKLEKYPDHIVDRFHTVCGRLGDEGDWSKLVETLASAATSSLAVPQALAYESALAELWKWVQRTRESSQICKHIDSVAATATEGFCVYLRSEGHETLPEFQLLLEKSVNSYLSRLCEILPHPAERDVAFLHLHAWVKELAPRFEFDFAQWSFLIASVEQAVYTEVGADSALFLTRYLKEVSQSLGELNFVGSYARQLESIALRLLSEDTFPYLDFEWEDFVLCTLVDDLHQTNVGEVSLLSRYIVTSSSVLGGISCQDFRLFGRLLVNASRELMERNFLDRLEDSLERIASSIQCSQLWSETEDQIWELVESTITSLGEAIQAVEEDKSLENDLFQLLKAAADAGVYSPNLKRAIDEYSRLYAVGFGSRRPKFWARVAPLITGSVTALNKTSPNRYLSQNSDGLKIFSYTQHLIEAVNIQVECLENSREILSECSMNYPEGRLLHTLAHRIGLEFSLGHSEEAVRAVARWSLCFLSLRDSGPDLIAYCKDLARALPDGPLRDQVKQYSEWAVRLLLHRGLWFKSSEIAHTAAAEIYSAMPQYAEATGSAEGLAKCARDSAFALRKLALAFSPEVVDPAETFGAWWRSLIDHYVHNRPSGLFSKTAELLIQATSEFLGEEIVSVMSRTLKPVYAEAETKTVSEESQYQFPLVKALFKTIAGAEEKQTLGSLLEIGVSKVPIPDFSKRAELEKFLQVTLLSSLSFFKSSGQLNRRTVDHLRALVEPISKQEAAQLEMYLAELRFALANPLGDARELLALTLLQSVLEDVRMVRLGKELKSSVAELAKQVPGELLAGLIQPLGGGTASWSRFESIRGALIEVARDGFSASQREQILESIIEWASTQLDPALILELGFLIFQIREALQDKVVLSFFEKLSSTEGFLFSPTPAEEEQWRRFLSWSLLSRGSAKGSIPSQASVVSTLPICQDYDFVERLETAYRFLCPENEPGWTAYLKALGDSLRELIQAQEALTDDRDEVTDQLAGALNSSGLSVHAEVLVDLLQTRLVGKVAPDRLGLPTLVLLSAESYGALNSLDEQAFQTLEQVGHKLDSELRQYWSLCYAELKHYRNELPAFLEDWARVGRQETLGWTARKQLIDVLTQQHGSFEWFRRELAPYQASEEAEQLRRQIENYTAQVVLGEQSVSLKIHAVDLLRNVSSALLSHSGNPIRKLATSPNLPSIMGRENALRRAVDKFPRLFRTLDTSATREIEFEQLLGLSSRLQFESLKALFSSDGENLRSSLETEQMATLSKARSLPAAEFFARWDLLERRADLMAAVELTRALAEVQADSSRIFARWVHSISSYSEPSVLGHFLSGLPGDVTVEELSQLREDLSRIEAGSPRVVALLERWNDRIKRTEESLDFLAEPSLGKHERSLIVGMLCAREDDSIASANRFDEVLQALEKIEPSELSADYEMAYERVQEIFLAHDLSGILRELKARTELIRIFEKRSEWESSLDQLGERIWSLFPSRDQVSEEEHLNFLQALPLIVGQPSRTPTYWRMSSIIVGLSERLLTALLSCSESEVKKWQVAILNAVGRSGLPRPPFEESFQRLNLALEKNPEADIVLHSSIPNDTATQITPSLLLSLKLASDLLSGSLDSQEACRWLVGATSHTSSLKPSALVKNVKDALVDWSLGSYPEDLKSTARGIKLRLETAAGRSEEMSEMMGHLVILSDKSDLELDKDRSWFSKLSDSFEAVVRR